jgi:hypothetical protein
MINWHKGMDDAPKDQQILGYLKGDYDVYHWQEDKLSQKPRPYWASFSCFGRRYERDNQPTHWALLEPPEDAA